jgi:phospholipase C
MGLQFLQDLPHDWSTTHTAWNGGRYDQWVPAKGTTTMAYMTRNDIPYHYALADAFTICDAYHSSAMTQTDPNRYYMWTGWVGNDGNGGGPVVDNSETGYSWSTYPEMLDSAGVSWKIYQDIGTGLDSAGSWGWTSDPYIGNYGDNSLLYFNQYRNAQPGSSLYQKARTGTNAAAGDGYFDQLKRDVAANSLPQVSWIVAPEAFSEHPNWPANYGAWYVDQALQVLTSNADLWSKTVLLINYDENDGFFDHIVPPTPPADTLHGASNVDTTNELYAGSTSYAAGPYGLGPRVPLIAVSPWSKGGYVCSQVFDHTSVIRFIEKRFGANGNLKSPNITAWREAISGDLMSVFNFKTPNAALAPLPSTSAYAPTDKLRHADYVPVPPLVQAIPKQEPGLRLARAVPYDMRVRVLESDASSTSLRVRFDNDGDAGVVFQVYAAGSFDAPFNYTVARHSKMNADLPLSATGAYDFTIYGPNGFIRRFAGMVSQASGRFGKRVARPSVDEQCDANSNKLSLVLRNDGTDVCTFAINNRYDSRANVTKTVRGSDTQTLQIDLSASHGWYDLDISVNTDTTFARRIGGHVETGNESYSDPALAG